MRLNKIWIWILSLLCLGGAVYFLFRLNYFTVRYIQVDAPENGLIPLHEVNSLLSAHIAKPILSVSTVEIQEQIKTQFLEIAEIKVAKRLPQTLEVAYRERQPILIAQIQEQKYYVSSEGVVFARVPAEITAIDLGLPQIVVENVAIEEDILGKQLPVDELEKILTVVGFGWQVLHVKLNQLTYEAESNLLRLDLQNVATAEKPEAFLWQVWLSISEEIETKLKMLNIIVYEADQNGQRVASVDLRFARPVVRYH